MSIYGVVSSFLGTGVEFVEALTIILAVGAIRGWKSAVLGGVSAVIVLGVLIAIIGAPLAQVVKIGWVQLIIGLFMLLFGIRWLRKAIMRYSGLKALHNEEESYQKEVKRIRGEGEPASGTSGIDRFAFATSFSGTFLEGLEAIFIVITFGLSTKAMGSAVLGAGLATIVVVLLGLILRKPLAKIPENTMKFIVGVMLTSFGAFWVGESMDVAWPGQDLSVLYIAVTLVALSLVIVKRCKAALNKASVSSGQNAGGVAR